MQEFYFEDDLDGNLTCVNDALCRSLGYSREELIGMNYRQYTEEKNRKKLTDLYLRLFETGEPVNCLDMEATCKDGTKLIYETSVSLIRDGHGHPVGFRGIARDVTERKQMEEALRQSESRYRGIVENMEDGYFETDLRGHFTFVNDAECRNLGYRREEMIGMSRHRYANPKNAEALVRLFTGVYETGTPVKYYDLELKKQDGATSYNEISVSLIRNAQGEPVGFRGIARDVTERKRQEEKIQYLATHDVLTGLPNRTLFGQLLSRAIEAAKRKKRRLAVLFIDLDRFKTINDTLGHDAGDRLLQEMAERFRQALRAMDVVCRLGGDEFVVMIEDVEDEAHIITVAQKLLSTAAASFSINGEHCRVTASIGISIYPQDGLVQQELIQHADMAMYLAKEKGKNGFEFFSKDLESPTMEKFSLEAHLRKALAENELSLAYQAKVDLRTGAITGVEALLRWNSRALGSVPPNRFLPVAEETALIVPMGRWVLKTACRQHILWQDQGLPPLHMTVNLSLRQLMDEEIINDVENALRESGMGPDLLELDISEETVMQSHRRIFAVLTRLSALGVCLAIDDFGKAYASLSRVLQFPIRILKADRSLIANLPLNDKDKALTQAIAAMGKTLKLTVVAEGVETWEQMDSLRRYAFDEMQGFYFSKPLGPEDVPALIRRHLPPCPLP